MSSAAEPVLALRGASKWYGEVLALADVTLEVGPGTHGLLGPNGAGKSTLLALAAGIARPSSGEVRVLGRDPSRSCEARARIGYAPHEDLGYEELSPLECGRWLLGLDGTDEGQARSRTQAALLELGLGELAGRPLAALSRGARQRVKVALALAHEPAVLLLDEPFEGCDPLARERLRKALRRHAERGGTIIVSSHILQDLEPLVDRVVVLRGGRKVAEGRLDELGAASGALETVRLGAASPRALGGQLMSAGLIEAARVVDERALEVVTRDARGVVAWVGDRVLEGALVLESLEVEDDLASRYRAVMSRESAP